MGLENILGLASGLGETLGTGAINYLFTKKLNKENAALNQQYWDLQAQKQFQLNERSADNAMKRTIDMYNLLQSPSAMVKQLREAGLNPALMYSKSGMGGTVSSGPQGGSNGGSGAPTLGLQQAIDPLTMAQIKNINADTSKKNAETNNIIEDTSVKESLKLLNNQELSQNEKRFVEEIIILQLQQGNIEQDTETKLADKYAKDEQANESQKRQDILNNEKKMSDIDLEFKKIFKDKGIDLDSMPGIASLIIQLGNKGKELLDKWLGDKWIIDWPENLKWWGDNKE